MVTETSLMGRRVILASVHLDHLGAGEVRLAQAETLLSELDRMTGVTDSHALILAGDFNDTEDSPTLKCLKNAGYRDAYRTLHKNKGNTFPLPRPEARIDYVLVKGPAEIVAAEVILNNSDFSDHLGLTVVIR
jgi:endonuclease/exonuclease/phosphatase family metal-dependent hydrolase